MAFALRFLWREGGEDWLRDPQSPRAVTAFATRTDAIARRRQLLEQMASHVLGIDVVPYPRSAQREVRDAG